MVLVERLSRVGTSADVLLEDSFREPASAVLTPAVVAGRLWKLGNTEYVLLEGSSTEADASVLDGRFWELVSAEDMLPEIVSAVRVPVPLVEKL